MNILEFPGKKDANPPTDEEWQKLLEQAKSEIPRRMEYFGIVAQIAYKRYLILQANGFDRKQAWDFIKEDMLRTFHGE